MQHITLNTVERLIDEKPKHMRKNGYIPVSISGKSLEKTILLKIDLSTLYRFLTYNNKSTHVNLQYNDKLIECKVSHVQKDVMDFSILHVDFTCI